MSLIYVCESPSNREFSHGLPAVGTTAQKIYKSVKNSSKLESEWLDWLDDKVYRTNLVRCHADSGLQKRVDPEKDKRVKEAAIHCVKHLKREVEEIAKQSTAKRLQFVVAIGTGFPEWGTQVKNLIETTCKSANKKCDVKIDKHPSASSAGRQRNSAASTRARQPSS